MTIPYWLAENLPSKCECGFPIANNEQLTKRWCLNPICPYHMAARVEKMCKQLNVTGMGEKTALSLVKSNKVSFHFDLIPKIFATPPTILLEDLPAIVQVEGVEKQLVPYLKGKDDLEEAMSSFPSNLEGTKFYLRRAVQYFNIKHMPKRSNVIMNIMITGEIHGFPSRQSFVKYLNDEFGDIAQVHDCGVRKTGVTFLVKEEDAAVHNKTRIAQERNIPIVTPSTLIGLFRAKRQEMEGNNGSS